MNFNKHPKKNKERIWKRVFLAVLPGLVVFALIFAANTYYDLDLGKVMIEEITKIVGQLETTATTTLATLGGYVGIGTTTPATLLNVYGTGTQLRLSYSGTQYANFLVDAGGDLTISPTGGILSANTSGIQNKIRAFSTSTDYLEVTHSGAAGILSVSAGNIEIGSPGSPIYLEAITSITASSSNPILTVTQSGTGYAATFMGGNVGIGTTTPNHLLTVGKSGDATSTYALGVYGSIRATGAINANQSFDIAETYPIDPQCEANNSCPEVGDLVSISENMLIQKSAVSYDTKLIGVISENPAFSMGGGFDAATSSRLVALAGRVLVKVSIENGPIAVGDLLTSASSTPGVAMKTTKAGRVLGVALEPYNGEEIGKIIVFINPHWYAGSLTGDGTLEGEVFADSQLNNQTNDQSDQATSQESILDSFTQKIKQALASLGLAIENGITQVKELIAEKIFAKKVCLEGDDGETICVNKNQLKELLSKNQIQIDNDNDSASSTENSSQSESSNEESGEETILVCETEHLELCDTQEKCQGANLYWYDDACHKETRQDGQPVCTPNWQCTDWQLLPDTVCSGEALTQTRSCSDLNNCSVSESKPAETQEATGTKDCSPQNP